MTGAPAPGAWRLAGALAMGASLIAAAPATPLSPALVAAAGRPAPYPSFAQVPPIPSHVPAPAQWRKVVLATRSAGAQTACRAEAGPWTLRGTEAFAERARAQARPPPPVTQPADAADQALIDRMQARTIPPPRSRRAAEAP